MSSPKVSEAPCLENWSWPLDIQRYNRRSSLTDTEREHLGKLIAWAKTGNKGWHSEAKPALKHLLKPLYDVIEHISAANTPKRQYTISTGVVRLFTRAMHRYNCTYWAFSTDKWLETLGHDYYAYRDQYGVAANERQQVIATAYLLCGFNELDKLGRLEYLALARKVFGKSMINGLIADLLKDLRTWGYTETGNTNALHNALCMVLLRQRSPRVERITLDSLEKHYRETDTKLTRRGLVLISFILAHRGIIPRCIGREGKGYLKEHIQHRRAIEGVPPRWLYWCERWFSTTTMQPSSRISRLYNLLQVGRWLEQTHSTIKEPADWTRTTCAQYVAAVNQATVGKWSSPVSSVADRIGEPMKPRGKAGKLSAARVFFIDCQEWGWIPRRFNPVRDLKTPRSISALTGPDPRVVANDTWAKLVWAGMNLSVEDFHSKVEGRYLKRVYPLAMIKALALVWLFAGLRRNEIMRLRLGCIRWQASAEEGQTKQKVCLLNVPVNKTSIAFTKPIDGIVGEAIAVWEADRPPQPRWLDPKTNEQVHLLFSYRGRPIGLGYINKVLIPLLCRKAGVPREDLRGKITSHRARPTIASQLFNAKNPMSLFELQAWLGHQSPESTRHYTKINPTRLVSSFTKAGYFERNLRAIEVLIDQEAIKSGAAAKGEPWKFYDLGHGHCTYDFFDQCPHRMACAKCSFYRPKDSAGAQLLEGKANLQRMLQQIPLTEEEQAAVEDGIEAMNRLSTRLSKVPTPSGLTPMQLDHINKKTVNGTS